MNDLNKGGVRLLRIYYVPSQIIGWTILAMGTIGLLMIMVQLARSGGGQSMTIDGTIGIFQRSWRLLMYTGVVLLVVSQFMKYLFDTTHTPPLILRYIDKILYVIMLFVLYPMISISVYYASSSTTGIDFWALVVIPMLLVNIAKLLILFGIARILKKILPIIKKSKTVATLE